jgi:hypothetical protein
MWCQIRRNHAIVIERSSAPRGNTNRERANTMGACGGEERKLQIRSRRKKKTNSQQNKAFRQPNPPRKRKRQRRVRHLPRGENRSASRCGSTARDPRETRGRRRRRRRRSEDPAERWEKKKKNTGSSRWRGTGGGRGACLAVVGERGGVLLGLESRTALHRTAAHRTAPAGGTRRRRGLAHDGPHAATPAGSRPLDSFSLSVFPFSFVSKILAASRRKILLRTETLDLNTI